MTREEVKAVLSHLTGDKWLMASLMYGAGLRVMECLRLRVQGLDFGANHVIVHNGKGAKDRVTMLPQVVQEPLRRHLSGVQKIHQRDSVRPGIGPLTCSGAHGRIRRGLQGAGVGPLRGYSGAMRRAGVLRSAIGGDSPLWKCFAPARWIRNHFVTWSTWP